MPAPGERGKIRYLDIGVQARLAQLIRAHLGNRREVAAAGCCCEHHDSFATITRFRKITPGLGIIAGTAQRFNAGLVGQWKEGTEQTDPVSPISMVG
jgi:hypothetical protein